MSTYKLDPALQDYIDTSARFVPDSDDLASQRINFARACKHFTPNSPSYVQIQDDSVSGVPVRIYRPVGPVPTEGWPTVLYLHGGGWTLGDETTHDWFAFSLLRRVSIAVVAVGYRLAPECPFPAPLDDALAVWHALRAGYWSALNSVQPVVAGDSAGGALAAGLCMAMRDQGLLQPCLQALIYPILTARLDLPSMLEHADAPHLSTSEIQACLRSYLPHTGQGQDLSALPLDADNHQGLAPAFIGVAEFDPLFDHGMSYGKALREAGIAVSTHVGRGLIHGSLRASGVKEVERLYDALSRRVSKALSTTYRR